MMMRDLPNGGKSGNNVKNSNEDANGFHRVMKPILITAQCFGLMPVSGIASKQASDLRFTCCSIRFVYCIFSLAGLMTMTVLNALEVWNNKVSFATARGTIFFTSTTLNSLLFLQLASNWRALVLEWEFVEQKHIHYGYPRNLRCKINSTTILILLMAAGETILANINAMMWATTCERKGEGNLIYCYAMSSYKYIFKYMNYSTVVAILAIFFNTIATFTWSFIDLFIMLVSISLTERFHLLNDHLRYIQGKIIKEASWNRLREEYNNLSSLTKILNSFVSKIILLSYGTNLYFICTQLLNSLTPIDSTLEKCYFYLSFGYLLLRAGISCLCAAEIYEESKVPRDILYCIPSGSYCAEVLRFERQVTTDEVALSALNFFSVTRSMLLTLAGTIVTYEIVLVQFNNINTGGSCSITSTAAPPVTTVPNTNAV